MVEMKAAGLSYASIAVKFNISRQRIQTYFSPPIKIMEEVAERAQALCEECGTFDQFGHYHHKVYQWDILNTEKNILYLCVSCHSDLNGETHFCRNCGKRIASGRSFCNKDCRIAYRSTSHECTNCHKIFSLTASQSIRVRRSQTGWLFCSKQCQGQHFAKLRIEARQRA